MAKPNYQYQKRQKELEKKRKNEEKRARKAKDAADVPVQVEPQEVPPPHEPPVA